MARALNAGPAFHQSREDDYADIERHYRELLERTLPPEGLVYEPIKLGPTWDWEPDRGWLLPDATLGWGVLSWSTYWLTGKGGKPWMWTPEQARVILWFYALDVDTADFLAHTYALQRVKGWGKDPTAAGLSVSSLHAPVMFDRWDGDRPVGRDDPDAWTQIVAVSEKQTKNTMNLFPSLIPQDTRDHYGIQVGKQNVWSDGDRRQIEAITSNPDSVEGGRPHLIVRAETQNWTNTNRGHEMSGAMEGNAAKSGTETPARIFDIFNAYVPGRDSVAERAREAWELTQGAEATAEDYGVLWDSLEAPPEAPLTKSEIPDVLKAVQGDAVWLDKRPNGRIVKSIMNPENPPSESRRKWYNQIGGTEDSWVDPRWVDDPRNWRRGEHLVDGDTIVLFGDGSKSDDATALVACRVSDGFLQTIHVQQPKAGEIVDRAAVDAAVIETHDRFRVVAFFFDPSHAKADGSVEDDRFWWPLVDEWHERYHKKYKIWVTKTGNKRHAVAFDMLTTAAQEMFQPAVTQLSDDLREGLAPHHGGDTMRRHMKHARRREGRFGYSIGKEHRSSKKKVDIAVCAVGARMLWRKYRLQERKGTPGKGRVLVME